MTLPEALPRSPSLPALSSRQQGNQCAVRRRRFSNAEQQAFGRCVGGRRSSVEDISAAQRGRRDRAASQPNLRCMEPLTTVVRKAATTPALSEVPSRASTPDQGAFDQAQLQGILERMLPTSSCPSPAPSSRADARSVASSVGASAKRRRSNMPALSGLPVQGSPGSHGGRASRFSRNALQVYRLRLLRHFRSLHDAFSSQSGSWEVPLGPKELRTALARISEGDGDELFASAPDVNWHSGMTLASFFQKLVDVSPESLLWELRCRLATAGLWQRGGFRMTKLMKHVPASEVGDEQREKLAPCFSEADTSSACELKLGHDSWMKLCEAIGLSTFEASRLAQILEDETKQVQISSLSGVLRVMMAFDASFMQLAASLIEHDGSLRSAFEGACINEERTMHWEEFCKLTSWLDISESHLAKLWDALVAAVPETQYAIAEISENQFVDLLVPWAPDLLQWAPNLAFGALERELGSQFGSLAESRRALRQHGLPGGFELSQDRLREGLATVGVLNCDPDVLLAKARQVAGISTNDPVTLEDVVEALRNSWQGVRAGKHELLEKETGMRFWKQLSDEENDLMTRWRHSDSCDSTARPSPDASTRCSSRSSSKSSCASLPSLSAPQPPAPKALPAFQVARRRPSRARMCGEDARRELPKLFESSQELIASAA